MFCQKKNQKYLHLVFFFLKKSNKVGFEQNILTVTSLINEATFNLILKVFCTKNSRTVECYDMSYILEKHLSNSKHNKVVDSFILFVGI